MILLTGLGRAGELSFSTMGLFPYNFDMRRSPQYKFGLSTRKASLLAMFCSIFLLGSSASAVCSDERSPLSSLVTLDKNESKVPLILVHGIHGTKSSADVTKPQPYWDALIAKLSADPSITKKYALYLFQYCSDKESVSRIGESLRDAIDQKLRDRQHSIVAHSMGGLVAKSYMAETTHRAGAWKDKRGGETVIDLITLATPHHGTPGANLPATLERYAATSEIAIVDMVIQLYWRQSVGRDHPSVRNSAIVNRADLRWDNFDRKFDPSDKDLNADLAKRNAMFAPYTSKMIAYAGAAESRFNPLDILTIYSLFRGGGRGVDDKHQMLKLANIGLVRGLDNHFGEADGLVPVISALACSEPPVERENGARNSVCPLASRVRRFEPGGTGSEVGVSELPDPLTLSIFRAERGFDHLDMRDDPDVLGYVVRDLNAATPGGPAGKGRK